jgi:hypothetical protein
MPSSATSNESLPDRLADALEKFEFVGRKQGTALREVDLVGAVAGFLTAAVPGVSLETEVQFQNAKIDLVASSGTEKVILEVKQGIRGGAAVEEGVRQLSRYIERTGISDAILFVFLDGAQMQREADRNVVPGDGVIRVISPKDE